MTPKRRPIAFPGAAGTHTEQAANRFFGVRHEGLTCPTPADAVKAAAEGSAFHVVMPVENSVTGGYAGVVEAFFAGEVAIIGEVVLTIRHALLSNSGAHMEDLGVIASHAAILAQCRDWLRTWGVATRAAQGDSEAAQELAQSGDQGLGVLGCRELAETYGLEVLADGLADHADNRSRFYIMTLPELAERLDGTRTALLLGPGLEPATLKALGAKLEALGARRVRVPVLGSEDGQRYLVEFDHEQGASLEIVREACEGLSFRFLGVWTPGVMPGGDDQEQDGGVIAQGE